jgi:glycosyltransferase involved in cell wall biosynthesis
MIEKKRESSINRTKDDRITIMLSIDRMIIGGAEQQFLELVKYIDKTRFRLIVVTLYPGGDLEEEIKSVPNIEYVCLNRNGKLDFSILFTLLRLLRQKKVDIIQPFLTPATFFTLLPAIISRTPIKIVTERGGFRIKPGLGYSLYLRMEDWLTRFADWIIPNSEAGKNHLIGRGIKSSRIRVIYNGINLYRLTLASDKIAQIRASLELPANGLVVGISASLTPSKDHRTFLRAARLISLKMPHVKFAILGDGPLRSEMEDFTRELGIWSKTIFLGNQTEVGPYVANFDVACLCSSEAEGCSNAILEAMAFSKPVVVTDVGGNGELVKDGETGLIINARDPQLLADAILFCFKQPEQAAEMGRRAREMLISQFSLDRMVHNYEALYEETVRNKRIKGYDESQESVKK